MNTGCTEILEKWLFSTFLLCLCHTRC